MRRLDKVTRSPPPADGPVAVPASGKMWRSLTRGLWWFGMGAVLQVVLIGVAVSGGVATGFGTIFRDLSTRTLLVTRPGFQCLVIPPDGLVVPIEGEGGVTSPTNHRGPNFAALAWAVHVTELGASREDLTTRRRAAQRQFPSLCMAAPGPPNGEFTIVVDAGWPLKSVRGAAQNSIGSAGAGERWATAWCLVINATGSLPPWRGAVLVPLRPQPIAFVGNAVALGLIACAAVFITGYLRATWRQFRGRCSICGYSVAAGGSRRCPECGSARRARGHSGLPRPSAALYARRDNASQLR